MVRQRRGLNSPFPIWFPSTWLWFRLNEHFRWNIFFIDQDGDPVRQGPEDKEKAKKHAEIERDLYVDDNGHCPFFTSLFTFDHTHGILDKRDRNRIFDPGGDNIDDADNEVDFVPDEESIALDENEADIHQKNKNENSSRNVHTNAKDSETTDRKMFITTNNGEDDRKTVEESYSMFEEENVKSINSPTNVNANGSESKSTTRRRSQTEGKSGCINHTCQPRMVHVWTNVSMEPRA